MAVKRDYSKMTPIEVYTLVAKGKLKVFPNGYLNQDNIMEMVRNLVLNVHGYSREEALKKMRHKFFQDNYLGGARKFFDNQDYKMIAYCFPEWDVKPWEFVKVHPDFWKDEQNRKDFIIWIAAKEGLDLNKKEDLRKITAAMMNKYGGSKCLKHSEGLYELLDSVSDERYKKWEIIKMTSWSKEEIIEATKWLIEEKLKYKPEQVCEIKVKDFVANNLDGMLQKGCNHSILEALELAYPGKYYRTKARGICYRI